MSELICHERMTALRAGMASVMPVQMLPVMSAMDSDVRICGLPEIDLDFLMVNKTQNKLHITSIYDEKNVAYCATQA